MYTAFKAVLCVLWAVGATYVLGAIPGYLDNLSLKKLEKK